MTEAHGASSTGETTPALGAATKARPRDERPFWREALAPYARPRLGRSLLDLASSVLPYLALSVLMYVALDVSYLLALALAVPASGFLLRTYIVFHDCAHGSFLPSKRANAWLGVALGLVVYEAFLSWRHSHAVHHATAGDLDRRGVGDEHAGKNARCPGTNERDPGDGSTPFTDNDTLACDPDQVPLGP